MQQVLTNSFTDYIAQIILEDKGNLYIAIGSGDSSWDLDGVPDDVSQGTSSLILERAIAPVASVEYLDDNDEVSATPTSKIRITSKIFTGEDYLGAIRECGLFSIRNQIRTMLMYSVFARLDLTEHLTLTKSLVISLAS